MDDLGGYGRLVGGEFDFGADGVAAVAAGAAGAGWAFLIVFGVGGGEGLVELGVFFVALVEDALEAF